MPLRSVRIVGAGTAAALLSGCGSAASPPARIAAADRAALVAEIPAVGESPAEAATRLARFRADVAQLVARHRLAGGDARVLDRIADQAAAKVSAAPSSSPSTSASTNATPPPVRTVTVTAPAPAAVPGPVPPGKPPKPVDRHTGDHGRGAGHDKKKKDHGGD